jgi:hypothetical protein
MIVEKGNKIHIMYRALFESSTRRHFIGEVMAVEGCVCRMEGYAFVYDPKTTMFEKKMDRRMTVIDLAESGYVVNILDPSVNVGNVAYEYKRDTGLIAVDGERFVLNINEFGSKS